MHIVWAVASEKAHLRLQTVKNQARSLTHLSSYT